MSEFKKKIDSFPIILTLILFFFTTIIFLSIPVLFNYKSIEKEIEKKIYNDFKINLTILDEMKYGFFPKPHLIIKKAILNINNEKKNLSDIESKDLKIFIPIKNIYSKSDIKISSIEIKETNFNFVIDDFKEFRNHLYYRINKPIRIKNSKFFYLDKKKKVIIISPINSLNYLIDKKREFKQLKINGNIFDTNFASSWKRYYDKPKNSKSEINFKNPNIAIESFLEIKEDSNYNGNINFKFLKENLNFDYSFGDDKITISSNKNKNQEIKIDSKIDLNPFYLNGKITFTNKNMEFVIDNILKYLLSMDKELLGNINGEITLNFKNLDNEIIDNGKINLIVNEKSIKILESLFEIQDIGIINSKYIFYENLGEIIFKSENVLEIIDKNEFAKKFQLNSDKVKNIDKIYFDLEKNIDNNEISISNIYLNNLGLENISKEKTTIKNIQVLKSFLYKNLN